MNRIVFTPHIGGVLEYYQLKGNRLRVIHSRGGEPHQSN